MNNSEDIKNQFSNAVKIINKTCFNSCFNTNSFRLDNTCAKVCYEKFIKTINIVHSSTVNISRSTNSEIIDKVVKPDINVFEEYLIFPMGGTYSFHPLLLTKHIDDFVYYHHGMNEFLPDTINR